MSEEVLATNGVSTEGVEDSAMDVMTSGEAGEGKEKSIMEMIAAGDFDAGSDDPPANDTPGEQVGEDVQMEEVPVKEENKVAEEAIKETGDEVKINGGDVEIKKEKDGDDAEGGSAAAASAGEEVTSGESAFKIDMEIIQFLNKTLILL